MSSTRLNHGRKFDVGHSLVGDAITIEDAVIVAKKREKRARAERHQIAEAKREAKVKLPTLSFLRKDADHA